MTAMHVLQLALTADAAPTSVNIDTWFFVALGGIVGVASVTAAVLGFLFSKFAQKEHLHPQYVTKEHTHEEYVTKDHVHEQYVTHDDHAEKCEYRSSRHHELVRMVQNHEATQHQLEQTIAVLKTISEANAEHIKSIDAKLDTMIAGMLKDRS